MLNQIGRKTDKYTFFKQMVCCIYRVFVFSRETKTKTKRQTNKQTKQKDQTNKRPTNLPNNKQKLKTQEDHFVCLLAKSSDLRRRLSCVSDGPWYSRWERKEDGGGGGGGGGGGAWYLGIWRRPWVSKKRYAAQKTTTTKQEQTNKQSKREPNRRFTVLMIFSFS